MARYTVHTTDGPKRKTIYGRQYKQVEKKLAEARGDVARGIVTDDQKRAVATKSKNLVKFSLHSAHLGFNQVRLTASALHAASAMLQFGRQVLARPAR
jgi:hypothetical protein